MPSLLRIPWISRGWSPAPYHGSRAMTRSPSPFAWRPDFLGAPREAHWPRRRTSRETVKSTISSVSCSVVSDSLRPHGLQHARPPCPSPTPGACPNSCPSSQWCHLNISSCCPLLLLPSIFPSIRVFFNKSVLFIRWPKYWSFSFRISLSNE